MTCVCCVSLSPAVTREVGSDSRAWTAASPARACSSSGSDNNNNNIGRLDGQWGHPPLRDDRRRAWASPTASTKHHQHRVAPSPSCACVRHRHQRATPTTPANPERWTAGRAMARRLHRASTVTASTKLNESFLPCSAPVISFAVSMNHRAREGQVADVSAARGHRSVTGDGRVAYPHGGRHSESGPDTRCSGLLYNRSTIFFSHENVQFFMFFF